MSGLLAIGGLHVAFVHDSALTWDKPHRAFLLPDSDSALPVDCRLEVIAGPAPSGALARVEAGCVLADAGLWSLHPIASDQGVAAHIRGYPSGPMDAWLMLDACAKHGRLYLGANPPAYLGYPITPLLWTLLLARAGGLLCHACGLVAPDGRGLLFSGMSGHGKTTTARLWAQVPGARVLSDDRVVLRPSPSGGFTLHGTPWPGEGLHALPGSAPLAAIYFLKHGLVNRAEPFSPALSAGYLLARTTPPIWQAQEMAECASFAARACQSVPCSELSFVPDASATQYVLSTQSAAPTARPAR